MNPPFENLEQRMVNTYIDTFPSFVPSEVGPRVEAQEQFYWFMHGLYRRLGEEPQLLVRDLHEDDAHTNRFNKGQDNKPKLANLMRKVVKEVDALLTTMFLLGQSGWMHGDAWVLGASSKISKKHRLQLKQLGLDVSAEPAGTVLRHPGYPDLFAAWTWMATRDGASLLDFSRCFFLNGYGYASQIYARLSGHAAAFGRLEGYLIENGYTRVDNWGGEVTLDYFKSHGDPAPTKGGFQYGIRHTGISASYDLLVKEPAVYGLCVPRMKEILIAFDSMENRVKAFVVGRTKKCDGCRYCVQTDKTGKRPLAHIPVTHEGRDYRLCSYFPGYNYCWTSLSDDLVDAMIGMLDFMDRLFDGD